VPGTWRHAHPWLGSEVVQNKSVGWKN